MQSQGIVATVKHYAANSQETERGTINEIIDERALRENYLPAFQAAVEEGHAWAVMNAYNRVNGLYCTANGWLNNTVLKGEWGFPGVLMSDWGAVHDPRGRQRRPRPGDAFPAVPQRVDHQAAARLGRRGHVDDRRQGPAHPAAWRSPTVFLDRSQADRLPSLSRSDPHSAAVALAKIAREAPVLLKNDGALLPSGPRARVKSIAVVGPERLDSFVGWRGRRGSCPRRTRAHFVSPDWTACAIPGGRLRHRIDQRFPAPAARFSQSLLRRPPGTRLPSR